MTWGARSWGTRGFGDTTHDAGLPATEPAAPPEPMSFTFTGATAGAFTFTEFMSFAVTGSGDMAVDLRDQYALKFSFAGAGFMSIVMPPKGRRKRLVPVRMDGTPLASELAEAKVGAVTWELNVPDTYGATMLPSDDQADVVHAERFREAQVWLGDSILTWGPIVNPVQDHQTLGINGRGVDWYYSRRNVGKADRHNYVANGSFEDGLAGWTAERSSYLAFHNRPGKSDPPVTEIVKFPHLTGSRAVRLTQAVEGHDSWLSQTFTWTTNPAVNPDGDEFTFRAYCWLNPGDYIGPANEERGLFIARYSTTELDPDPLVQQASPGQPLLLEYGFVPLNDETPTETWHRMEYTLLVPPTGEPEFVQVRLYPPQGTVVYDEVALTLNETERFRGMDQSLIVERLADHLADPAYDKSILNVDYDTPPTGILRNRDYVHAEHPNGWQSMTEFCNLRDGLDLSMQYGANVRTLRTHFPAKGRWRPSARLSYGQNISTYSWGFSGDAAATAVVTLGENDGSDREEGFATDVSGFAEGLVLEEVFSPGPDTPIDALDDRAAERLQITREPIVLTLTTFPDSDLIGRVETGDWVPVDLHDGALHLNSTVYRVVRITLNEDLSLTLTLNRRDVMVR